MQSDMSLLAAAEAEATVVLGSDSQHIGDYNGLPTTSRSRGTKSQSSEASFEETPLIQPVDNGGRDTESRFGHEADAAGDYWPGKEDLEGLPWRKRPSIFWLLPPFMLTTLAFGGIVVPKLNLILSLICRQYLADKSIRDPSFQFMPVVLGVDNPQCQIPEVQSLVSRFTLYCNLAAGILSAITSPKLGSLSDRYGRKKVIAVTTSGMLFGEIITIAAATWPDAVSVNWILAGNLVDGICGSFIASMALTNSYATDCTPPAKRNEVFGLFHGALFTGIAAGPIIGGYIVEAAGSILAVFYVSLACHLLFILMVLFVLPESLSKTRQMIARDRHRIDKSDAPPWSMASTLKDTNLLAPLDILYPTGEGSSRALRMNLILLAAVDTIMFGVAMGSMIIVVIYSEYVFGWGNLDSSVFVSVVNTCRVFMLVVVLPLVSKLLRRRQSQGWSRDKGSDSVDISIIRTAVFFDMMGYLGYTLARTGHLFTLSGAIASIGGMGSPTLQSALTKHVPPDRTGQLLGASGLLHALARVVAPTIFNLIYSATVGQFTQTVFVCLTVCFGVAFLLSWFIKPHVYFDEDATARRARMVPESQ